MWLPWITQICLFRRVASPGVFSHSGGFQGQVPRVFPSWVIEITKGAEELAGFLEESAASQATTRKLQFDHINRHRFGHQTWTHFCFGVDVDVCMLHSARRVAQGGNRGCGTQGADKRPCRHQFVSRRERERERERERDVRSKTNFDNQFFSGQSRCGMVVRSGVGSRAGIIGQKGANICNVHVFHLHGSSDKVGGVTGASKAKCSIHFLPGLSHSAVRGS